MKQVKVFSGRDEQHLERQINQFLETDGKPSEWKLQGFTVTCDPHDDGVMDYAAILVCE